jgi:hypothetical protein
MIFWTPPIIDRLKALIAVKPALLFSDIARTISTEFGIKLSAPACIGKAYRLRGGRPTKKAAAPKPPITGRARARPRALPLMEIAVMPKIERKPHVTGNVTIMELQPHSCRWIDGHGEPYLYCGDEKLAGFWYCAKHAAIAYRPAGSRDRITVPK